MSPGHSGQRRLVGNSLDYPFDQILFGPRDIDPEELPVARITGEETYVLGAFNPGLCRLPNGHLLIMVRVAEALRAPVSDDTLRVLRFAADNDSFVLDPYPVADIDFTDPRKYRFKRDGDIYALTSLSWLLPVELDEEGQEVIEIHYDKMILPGKVTQEYGIEDARITQIEDIYYMTVCAVASERHSTMLYQSRDGLNYSCEGVILDHQNKDMVIFPEKLNGSYHALTRPQGELYFKAADNDVIPGPSINLASSPDMLHWRPLNRVLVRPQRDSLLSRKVGGGAPPIRTPEGWLVLFHGVSEDGVAGKYRTVWMLLDPSDPQKILACDFDTAILEADPSLTRDYADAIYLPNIVFTTGIVAGHQNFIVASGELDLCCRITHIPRSRFELR